ncbi:MAG: TonB-dependent receptor [Acidobacteria bacterium]|nr:TonB-dependent receptor [Acidobacteriota bacterium]
MQFAIIRVCILGAVIAAAAFGQAAAINGQISGTVTDPSGAPVAAAHVEVVNGGTGYRQTATTSSSGLFQALLLPLGEYSVTVEAAGFTPYRRTGVVLTAGSVATIDVALQLKGIATEVLVESGAPLIDVGRTDVGATLSSNAVDNLPLVSRNPYNFVLQQPNVSGHSNTEFGVPRKVNANGFNGRINYQLDGSNNVQSDRAGIRLLPISQTWVQEVQAVSNGFAPEFGNTVGTVFNTVTRSGTNALHGESGYLFRRTPMSARPALLPDSAPTPEVNVDSFFGNAGGRIVRDRLFFFAGAEHVKRDLPAPVTVPADTLSLLGLPQSFGNAIPFSQNVTFFLGKLDWQISNANRLSVRYNGHRNDSPYNSSVIGGQYLVDRTFTFADRSHAGAVQLVSVLTANAVNEARLQIPFRSQAQNRFQATGTGPSITIPGVAYFGNSLDVGYLFDEMTPEFTDNFSWNRGAHAFKFGGSARAARDTQVQPTIANYTFPNVAAYLAAKSGVNPKAYLNFIQTLGNPAMSYNSLFSGAYAQDTWKPLSNVTITYGIRYDVYSPPSANENSPFDYPRRFRTDRNNFAPRLGVAIGKGRTVVRASGGIFYDPFQTDLYRRALLNNGSPQYFAVSLLAQQPFAPAFPNVLPTSIQGLPAIAQDITTVSPDFATLYSANANVSVSREFSSDLAVTATYLFTRGNRLPVYRNINLVPSGLTLADGRPIFGSGRVYAGFGNILVAESVGQSIYNGLNLTLTKRFSRGLEAFATYTWSHAIDDAPEQNNIDSSNLVLSDPTNRRRDQGNSLTDRRHVFNGNLLYTPTASSGSPFVRALVNGNVFALMATVQSGDLFNVGSNQILNGDPSIPASLQRPLFAGRNTLLAPRTAELNVRYVRAFPVHESLRVQFIAESTNILNRTNVAGLNSTALVSGIGVLINAPSKAWTAALDQRLIQLGIRLRF